MFSRFYASTFAALLVAAAVFLAGCAQGGSGSVAATAVKPASDFPLTVTDDAGRSVTFDKAPQRFLSLSASNTEIIYAIGLQDKLVGVDDFSDYPAEAKQKEKVGGFSKPNLEKIVSLSPDLVLATDLHTKSVVPELEKRNLKVLVVKPATLADVPDHMQLLGKLGGVSAAADKVAADFRARVDAVASKVKGAASKPRVFFEVDPSLITVGPGTFIDDMITVAGGENIARDAKTAWPTLSQEAVVLKDPQIIFLSDHGSDAGGVTPEIVKARPGWNTVQAVKTNSIVELPNRDLTDRPGPRAVEGLEFIAKTIHPELFK